MAEQLEATVIDVYQPTKGETWGVATVTTGERSGYAEKRFTVVGSVGMAKIGEVLVATGRWVTHPTYGKQFKADTVAFKAPTKREPLIRFLASTVSGIGETRAAMIVDHFGTDAMRILDARPDLLRTVKGLPKSLVPKMVEAYKTARCTKHRDILLYLQTAGVGPKLAGRIVERYGDKAEEVISEDPYVLMTQFAGVGFITCDKIADQLGIPANDRRRVRAALVHHITEDCEGQGHTHLPTEGLVDRLGDKMRKVRDVETAVIRTYLKELLAEGTIVFEGGRLYLARTHQTEITVATRLVEIAESRRAMVPGVANEAIAWAEAEDGVTLTNEQREAVLQATAGGLLALSGNPGTGKSLCTRAIVRALDNLRISYALCAPTGKAAQRSSEATGRHATTIHRLLGFKGEGFEYNASNQLGAGAVIVDETSMVDLTLARALLVAMKPGAALILVGDVDQLPSVMPGAVLDDVINSGLATVVRLTTIHRQGKGSAISLAAATVNAGGRPEGPNPYSEPTAEFAVVPLKESERIADATVDLVLRAREVWGFDPVREVQVITPMKKYASGVHELNKRLQEALNPVKLGVGEVRAHGDAFRPGDKVMQTKNDYQRMVFNGMVGYVVEVEPQSSRLTVAFADADEVVSYDREDLAHLVLAYASTVHKCVHPDTLVETNQGLLPIKMLTISGRVGAPAGNVAYGGLFSEDTERTMLEVEVEGGYRVTVTPEHGLDAWNGTAYVRTEAKDLVEGTFLRMQLGSQVEPDLPCPLPGIPSHDVRAVVYRLPTEVTEDVAEFFGLMVADGTLWPRGFRLAKRYAEVTDRFVELCHLLFGVESKRWHMPGKRTGAYFAEVNSTLIASWLSLVGGMGPNAKAIPECVLCSSSRVQAAFLRGLFEDGTVNMKGDHVDHIEWSQCKPVMVDQVAVMLLRLGIVCSRSVDRERLYIYGKFAEVFRDRIGYISRSKSDRLCHVRPTLSGYRVPVGPTMIQAICDAVGREIGKMACANMHSRGFMTRRVAEQVLASADASSAVASATRDALAYHHARVVAVRRVEGVPWCMDVPQGHQFFQNGFAGWNSQGDQQQCVIMPLDPSHWFMQFRALVYTGITRARKRCVLVGDVAKAQSRYRSKKRDERITWLASRMREIAGTRG